MSLKIENQKCYLEFNNISKTNIKIENNGNSEGSQMFTITMEHVRIPLHNYFSPLFLCFGLFTQANIHSDVNEDDVLLLPFPKHLFKTKFT